MQKTSKTYKKISECYKQILTGKMLCIDPSTGSKSSNPGYAWYEKGELIESGEIIVDKEANRNVRLYEIARCLREDFDDPDVMVIEYIPPVTYKKGLKMNNISIMALQKAIGAIISSKLVPHFLEIPAVSWKVYKPHNYKKTDAWDAVCLGLCALAVSKDIEEDLKVKRNKT